MYCHNINIKKKKKKILLIFLFFPPDEWEIWSESDDHSRHARIQHEEWNRMWLSRSQVKYSCIVYEHGWAYDKHLIKFNN